MNGWLMKIIKKYVENWIGILKNITFPDSKSGMKKIYRVEMKLIEIMNLIEFKGWLGYHITLPRKILSFSFI